MNKLCKVVGIALSTSLFSTMLTPTVAYADDTIDSATELISATIELAATGVESATYDTALETVLNNISVAGEEVSYEGTVIGYYDTSTPTTLYGDAEKTSPIISQKVEGFIVEPSLLRTLVSDFNDGLIDTYSPTDITDWSKIIGKYDVSFGDGTLTIPAEQWVELPSTTFNSNSLSSVGSDKILNLSKLTNVYYTSGSGEDKVAVIGYGIDESGKLYIQGAHVVLQQSSTTLGRVAVSSKYYAVTGPASDPHSMSINNVSSKNLLCLTTNNHSGTHCGYRIWLASPDHSVSDYLEFTATSTAYSNLYNVVDMSDNAAGNNSKFTTHGIIFVVNPDISTWQQQYEGIWESQSVSKTVVGNATLNARLAKLNGLTMADELTVTHAAWFVGETDIDDYLGETAVMEAGGQADIDTPTEIDPMSFNVIVPSSLPIKVNNLGEVYVADNAVISNYSCAAVTIKSVTITPKPDTGWTMVAEAPSKKRDAKEFTFSTSLTDGIDIGVDENLSFTYSAELSPLTEGADSLDLVTVSVVVDWAEEDDG